MKKAIFFVYFICLAATDRLIVWYVPKNQKEYWFTATTPRDNISLLKSAHRTA